MPLSLPAPPPDLTLGGASADLREVGLPPSLVKHLMLLRSAGEAKREIDRAHKLGISIHIPEDSSFPAPLRDHPDQPLVLYSKGKPLTSEPKIAIVGSRVARPSMRRFARELGKVAGQFGVAVVSGLARGIDAASHEGCLTGGGFPVGVLGTGIDRTYPTDTARLHQQVTEHGTLFTTFPLGTSPRPYHFPTRNRLISALARSVIVVSASEKSGTMSTARAAGEMGGDVGAVPGCPYDALARGTNRLIQDGARVILEPADALDPLLGIGIVPLQSRSSNVGTRDSLNSRNSPRSRESADSQILSTLERTPLRADEVATITGLDLDFVVTRLVELELSDEVEKLPGRMYLRQA